MSNKMILVEDMETGKLFWLPEGYAASGLLPTSGIPETLHRLTTADVEDMLDATFNKLKTEAINRNTLPNLAGVRNILIFNLTQILKEKF